VVGPRRSVKGALFLILMIDSLANGLFIPLSLLYLALRADASLTQIGVLLSVAGLVALPVPLLAGRLVDRFGARTVVLAAQILQAAGFAGYAMAGDLRIVFVAATVTSLGNGAFWSSIFGLISGLFDNDPDPRARERWLGVAWALRAVGYGIGASVAGLALEVNSARLYQSVIAGNVVMLIVAGVLLAKFVPRIITPRPASTGQARGYRVLWADRPFLMLIALNTVFALCNVTLSIGFAPFVTRALPHLTWIVGPLLAMNTVAQALLMPSMVRLQRGLPRQVSLCIAGLLWACWSLATMSAVFLPGTWRIPCLVLAVLCYSAAQMIHSPVSNAMAADAAPVDVRGRYLAIFPSTFTVASMAAPTIFSALLSAGPVVPWLVLALAALLTIPSMLLLARRLPKAALTGIRPQPETPDAVVLSD
jgi:MFS family permease